MSGTNRWFDRDEPERENLARFLGVTLDEFDAIPRADLLRRVYWQMERNRVARAKYSTTPARTLDEDPAYREGLLGVSRHEGK